MSIALAIASFFVVGSAALPAAQRRQPKPPELPVVQRGICPGEGCVYRRWTAEDTPDCFASVVEKPNQEWWAHVKRRSGQTGWVLMDEAKFSGIDALG